MFTLTQAKELTLNKFGGLYTEADPRELPPGASPQCWDVDFLIAEVGTRPGLSNPITSFTPALSNFPVEYLKSSTVLGPANLTLVEDAGTTLFKENLNAPGIFASFYNPILNLSRAISETVNQREYICLSDLTAGSDQPLQYDGTNVDRISQVGPGQGPSVTVTSPSYPILTIKEIYSAVNIDSVSWGSAINLHDAQPPSTNLYFLSAVSATNFTTGLALGDLVYVNPFSLLMEGLNPGGTYAVTSIGFFTDSDGTRQYFGVTASVANSDFVRGSAGITYQRTPAIIQLSSPLPLQDAVVGNKITIQGASVPQWNTTWTIAETPTEGQLAITATALTSNVATYDYTLQSGEAPGWQANYAYPIGAQIVDPNAGDGTVWQVTTPGTSAGSIPAFVTSPQTDNTVIWTKQAGTTQVLVTVFNTTNGNGIFNVQNAQILQANQTTFTIAITSPDIASSSESGQAVSGSGTALIIDPGTVTLGTGNPGVDPIYGNATGGTVLVSSTLVAAGQRYAVMMFLTRSGFITPASPPMSFFTTGQSGQLTFSNMALGPPDVIARIVAVTLANAGVGGPYYYVPNDVLVPGSVASLGVTQIFNKTVIDDNTSLSLGPISLSDAVLATSTNITTVGNNLQQERELGECVKVVQFAGRCFYLGERVKNDQFLNLTFAGGTLPAPASPFQAVPVGWTIDPTLELYTTVTGSGVFQQYLYINNLSGGVINVAPTAPGSVEALTQSAYETQGFLTPVILPNTAYSVRVIAGNPAALASGSLVIDLYSATAGTNWPVSVSMGLMNTGFTEFILPFNNPLWDTVPDDLELRVYPYNLANADDLSVYRIEVFPTEQPVYTTQVAASYADNPQAIDGLTGIVDTSLLSSETQTNHFKFLNKYYITTKSHEFSVTETTEEPAFWNVNEITNAVGCIGPLAQDVGEEYVVLAANDGVYIFDGGNHLKISQEIQQIWDLIYEPSKKTIWVLNDMKQQRILVGVPLPTPNFWLPDDPTVLTPATPNVILCCSYLGLMSGAEIAGGHSVFPSAFTGTLLFHDMKRKWNPWRIAAATAAQITRADNSQEIWLGQAVEVCCDGGVPDVTSLSPPNATVGGAGFTLTVNGTNFLPTSVVQWNGSDRATTYVSAIQLTATILAGDISVIETANVTVNNPSPGCGVSTGATFMVEAGMCVGGVPNITSLSPTSATAGGVGFTLTVNGTNFVATSVVNWNGSPRVTTYGSGIQVTAAILAADIASIGTNEVQVNNPSPGCGLSNQVAFDATASGCGATTPLFTDDFESYANQAAFAAVWSPYGSASGVKPQWGSFGFSGSNGVQISVLTPTVSNGTNGNSAMWQKLGTNYTTLAAGCYFMIPSGQSWDAIPSNPLALLFFMIPNGGFPVVPGDAFVQYGMGVYKETNGDLHISTTDAWNLTKHRGATLLAYDTWYRADILVTFAVSTGSVEIKLNCSTEVTETNIQTVGGSGGAGYYPAHASAVMFGSNRENPSNTPEPTPGYQIDDVYIGTGFAP